MVQAIPASFSGIAEALFFEHGLQQTHLDLNRWIVEDPPFLRGVPKSWNELGQPFHGESFGEWQIDLTFEYI